MYKRVCLYTTPLAFMQPLTSGVAACARRVGAWQIDTWFPSDDWGLERLFDGRYDGVIIGHELPSLPANFAGTRSKVVTAAHRLPGMPAVVHDNVAIGRMAAQHLHECGYRSFAFFGPKTQWSEERRRGYESTIIESGASCLTNQAPDGKFPDWKVAEDHAAVDRFIRRLPRRTALFVTYDGVARKIVDRAVEIGLRIPGDLAVMGVDNDELRCETGTVPMTSIDTNMFRMGHEAALLLDRLMRNETAMSLVVPPKGVVRRQSTSLTAHADPEIAAAMRFISERACDGITVEDICDHVLISRRRLEIRFRDAVGRSPSDEIRSMRVECARALLAETNLSISEVAHRCGYGNGSTFAEAFKRQTRLLPSEYRRQNPG